MIIVAESTGEFKKVIRETLFELINEVKSLNKNDNTLLTQSEVASMLKVSIPTLNSMKEKGLIPFTQIERKIYFKKQDVLNAIDALANKGKRG